MTITQPTFDEFLPPEEVVTHDYPRWAIYQGEMCRVLYYEGDGMFRLLDKRDWQKSVHRDRLAFPRPKKEA